MKKKLKTKISTMVLAVNLLVMQVYAEASSTYTTIEDSDIGAGIKNLIKDSLTLLQFLCPIAGALCAVYFFMRKSAADEADGKMWHKRIITAVICGVGGLLVATLIKVLAGYFNQSPTGL